ncbi:putative membrane protein [Salinibacter ruber]|nr:V-type proton ATPase subunit G [Salinibacter ruber]MCS3655175.1 putative membrane protein [Salinibacter ruber]
MTWFLALLLAIVLSAISASLYLRNRNIPEEAIQRASMSRKPNPYDVGAFEMEVREYLSGGNDTDSRKPFLESGAAEQLPSISELNIEKLNEKAHERRGYSAAFLDGALLYGGSVIHQHMAVDDNIHEGIGKLAGEDFGSFADLSSKVETYEHTAWTGLSEGTLEKVSGHVGESIVAEHFNEAGVDVEWPEESNQEGWDLLLNGHPVNAKVIQDADQLSAHFSEHAEIPAIVPADAENIPDDAVEFDPSEDTDELMEALASGQENLVIKDTELSHEEVTDQTENATDALLGDALGDGLAGGVPIVTLAVSGWREIDLHGEDKADWKSSAKNLSLDVAGTGGGAAAGGKGGALLGAALGGPPGAAAGAILGAVGGGIAGRMTSNHIKKKPLRDAAEKLESAQESLTEIARQEEKRCKKKFGEARKGNEKRLERAADEYSSEVEERSNLLREWRVEQAQISGEDAYERLGRALSEVRELQDHLKTKRDGAWHQLRRWLFPTAEALAVEQVISWTEETEQVLREQRNAVRSQKIVDRAELDELLGRYGLLRNEVLTEIAEIERERLEREIGLFEQVREFREKMGKKRSKAMERLGDLLVRLRNEMREALKPKIEKVADCEAKVYEEADKLGVEL